MSEDVLGSAAIVSCYHKVAIVVHIYSSEAHWKVDIEGIPHFSAVYEVIGQCEGETNILSFYQLSIYIVGVVSNISTEQVEIIFELIIVLEPEYSLRLEVGPRDRELTSSDERSLVLVYCEMELINALDVGIT